MKIDPDKYFNTFIRVLKKTISFNTYYLPNPYKLGEVRDYEKKINHLNFKKIFDHNYLIHDKKKFAETKVIFLSHYLGYEHIKDEDFYYGKIFNILKKKKINYSILMINKTNFQLQDIKKKFKNTIHSRIYVNQYSHPVKDIKLIIKLFINYLSFVFKKTYIKFNREEKKIISEKFTFLNFIKARTTLKLVNNIESILNDYSNNTQCIVFTFEGHAFERMLIEICKKKKIKSIGYFFSVIRQLKTNIFYKFPKFLMPDDIFTTGSVVKNYFKKNSTKIQNIHMVGSGRKFLNKKFNIKRILSSETCNILICPEGLYTETDIMFNLGLSLSQKKTKFNFNFRIHPELKQNKKYMGNLNNRIKNFRNFKISNNSLDDDINHNHILIYRGSSICVNGVLGGMVPIYYKLHNEISLDPLFEINQFKAENESQILRYIDLLRLHKNKKKLNNKMKSLMNYCKLYYENFDEKNILKYL